MRRYTLIYTIWYLITYYYKDLCACTWAHVQIMSHDFYNLKSDHVKVKGKVIPLL